MAIEECPHCLRKVSFGNDGICMACKNNRFTSPTRSRAEIELEQETIRTQNDVKVLNEQRQRWMLSGIGLITLASLLVAGALILDFGGILIWSGGFVLGAGLIGKSMKNSRQIDDLKFFFEKEHGVALYRNKRGRDPN